MAVSTGGADTLECLLTRVGIDEAEFSGDPNTPDARVHVFQGRGGNNTANPAGPSAPTSLWDSDADLKRYDIALLSCEGSPTTAGANPQTIARLRLDRRPRVRRALPLRVFARPDAVRQHRDLVDTAAADSYPERRINGTVQTTLLSNGMTFPEGVALSSWLGNVGALSGGTLPIPVARHDATVTWHQRVDRLGRLEPRHQPREHPVLLVGHAVQPARQRRGRARVLRARGVQRPARLGVQTPARATARTTPPRSAPRSPRAATPRPRWRPTRTPSSSSSSTCPRA